MKTSGKFHEIFRKVSGKFHEILRKAKEKRRSQGTAIFDPSVDRIRAYARYIKNTVNYANVNKLTVC